MVKCGELAILSVPSKQEFTVLICTSLLAISSPHAANGAVSGVHYLHRTMYPNVWNPERKLLYAIICYYIQNKSNMNISGSMCKCGVQELHRQHVSVPALSYADIAGYIPGMHRHNAYHSSPISRYPYELISTIWLYMVLVGLVA